MFGVSREEVVQIVREEIQKAIVAQELYVKSEIERTSVNIRASTDSAFNKWSTDAVKNINTSIDSKINTTRKSLENDINLTRTGLKESLSQAVEMMRANANNHVELQSSVVEITANLAKLEEARNQSISAILNKMAELQTNQKEIVIAFAQVSALSKKQSDLCVRLLEKANQTSEEILRLLAPKIEIKDTDLSLKLTADRSKTKKKVKNGNKL